MKPGDIILKVNNTKITQNNDLASFIQNRIPGETLELEIYRN
ncbi:MAG: PDZ domain-containing protein [Patescibacteria group bacterium]